MVTVFCISMLVFPCFSSHVITICLLFSLLFGLCVTKLRADYVRIKLGTIGQPLKMSTRDFSWGKGGRCVWLTTYHPCSAERQENPGP